MASSIYSIDEFKRLYFRFFTNFSPYPRWEATTNYFIDNIVYYDVNFVVYKAINDNINKAPDVNSSDWQAQPDINIANYITQTDLDNAYLFANNNLSGVLTTDNTKQQGFYLLMAHYLQLNCINVSQQGNQGFDGLLSSRGVGSVSEGYTVNQKYLDLNYSMLSKTRFGQEYISLCNLNNRNIIFLAKGGLS